MGARDNFVKWVWGLRKGQVTWEIGELRARSAFSLQTTLYTAAIDEDGR
jgi:hypothetical protein